MPKGRVIFFGFSPGSGIVSAPLPRGGGALMLETLRFTLLVHQFLQLRHYRAEEVLALQQKRLRKLLRHAVDHSPFYRERFRGLDVTRCGLTELPVLSKLRMMA